MPENEAENRTTTLYQMFDRNAQMIAGPILAYSRPGPAVRDFHAVLSMKETQPGRFPEDFELRQLGTQDEATGTISPSLRTITTGAAWLAMQKNSEQRNEPG